MFKHTLMASAIACLFATPAHAVSDADWAAMKAEIGQLKAAYEARIAELEARVAAAEAKAASAGKQSTPSDPPERAASSAAAGFNPELSLILQGRYAQMKDIEHRHPDGFLPAGHGHAEARGFSIDHTEVVMSAGVDHLFRGYANFALADGEVGVEEAWFQTLGLGHGLTLKGGRFLSAIGYQNERHPHAWDFADNGLVYRALFGEAYAQDGLQLKWLAPSDLFIEPFVEIGRGANFPGTDRNENGLGAVAAGVHVGGDVGASHSWRAGISHLHTKAQARGFDGYDPAGVEVMGNFTGTSKIWLADFVWKWAPNGNPKTNNFKFAAEYFRRNESGTLVCDDADPLDPSLCAGGLSGPYRASQSGFYAQGVYQFMPQWRAGYRYDRLFRGDVDFNGADAGAVFASLADYDPTRHTLMLDWSPSEFSRLRLQYARDRSKQGQDENQWVVQYIHSLGAHGAHKF